MMGRAENINAAILVWARETAGLTLSEAAERLGLSSSVHGMAKEKLQALESGAAKPTRNQLLRIANVYRRPLTAFYRSRPPVVVERGGDFRTMAGNVSRSEAALLDALLRDICVRQDMVRAILEEDEDARQLEFVGSMTIQEPVVRAARRIKEVLGIEGSQEFKRGRNSDNDVTLFAALRVRVEEIGVFVLLVGNLGSHHTNISEKVFRGFAIADGIAPFIVINDQDAPRARSFTLIHELAHIFVGSTGVSGAPTTVDARTSLARVERFCNDVSGEFLLPEDSLAAIAKVDDVSQAQEIITDIAANRNVSEAMVAYRFWRTERIDEEVYRDLVAMYVGRWKEARERQRGRARESDSGPSYYTIRRHRLGSALVNLVGRTVRANELTHTKASKVLGVKASNVEPLLRGVKTIGGSIGEARG